MHRRINEVLQKLVQPARMKKINDVLSLRKNNVRIVFDQLSDPFNAFACFRTCDCMLKKLLYIYFIYLFSYMYIFVFIYLL